MRIRERVRAFPAMYGQKIRCSAGLETGAVLSSVIRSDTRTYDIFGPAVNLAARIQGVAQTDTILIGPATHSLTKSAFRFKKHDARELKNVEKPVVTYEITGMRRSADAAESIETPFFGRATELAQLEQLWRRETGQPDEDGAGGNCAAVLVGESGIGKSRLAREFIRARGNEVRALKIFCAPHSARTPWGLWRSFFAVLAGMDPAGEGGPLRTGLRRVFKQVGLPEENQTTLLALLGEKRAVAQLGSVPSSILKMTIAADLRVLLGLLAAGQSQIVFFDDVQWADSTSLDVLDFLLNPPPPANTFFLITHRPDFHPEQPNFTKLPKLTLRELEPQHRRALFEAFCSDAKALAHAPRDLMQRVSGNPFYVMELARALSESLKSATTEDEQERALTAATALLPLSVQEMIQSRVDTLDSQDRQVLQCASVLGQRVPYSHLEMFTFLRDGLLARLYALKSQELLEEETGASELTFYFQHHAVREVAYHSLLDRQRRDLHRIVAEKLELRGGSAEDSTIAVLAFHFSRTTDHDKALNYLKLAGDHARNQAATKEALNCYDEALGHLKQADAPGRHDRSRLEILKSKGRLQYLAGDTASALAVFEDAMALARQFKAKNDIGWLQMECGYAHFMRSDYDSALEELNAALPVLRGQKDMRVLGQLYTRLGMCDWGKGDIANAREHFQQAADLKLEDVKPDIAADARNNLALIAWKMGRLDDAEREFGFALELFKQAGNKFGIAATQMNLGIMEENTGRYEEAGERYTRALELAEKVRFQQILTAVTANLANLCLAVNRGDEALKYSEQSLALAQRSGDRRSAAIAMENMALSQLLLRNFDRARRNLAAGRKIAKDIGDTERTFSLDLVEIELALSEGAEVPERKINKALEVLALRGFESEKPRLLRLIAMSQICRGHIAEGATTAALAMEACRNQNNITEQRRIEKMIADVDGKDTGQTAASATDSSADFVKIVDYDASWPSAYEREAELVRGALGDFVREINHIGSTSIEGMSAKPLIDMVVTVDDVKAMDVYLRPLEKIGYSVQPIDDTDRYCFKKGMPRTHHVHIVQQGGKHHRNMLAFRNYLRANPDTREQYRKLKIALAREFGQQRTIYTRSKSEFIAEVLERAKREKFNTPAPV